MKAEHRKELQTNVLADRLGKLVQGFREGFKGRPTNTSLLIWGGIALALVLIVGWKIYSSVTTKNRSAEWLQLDEASGPTELRKIAEKDNGAPGRIARFQLARVYMHRGME